MAETIRAEWARNQLMSVFYTQGGLEQVRAIPEQSDLDMVGHLIPFGFTEDESIGVIEKLKSDVTQSTTSFLPVMINRLTGDYFLNESIKERIANHSPMPPTAF